MVKKKVKSTDENFCDEFQWEVIINYKKKIYTGIFVYLLYQFRKISHTNDFWENIKYQTQ